jgi:FOG: PKD repeat
MKLQQCLLYCVILAIAITAVAIPVSADNSIVPSGGHVFIGEEGLDITATVPEGVSTVFWWASETSVPYQLYIPDLSNFYVDPLVFNERKGSWYYMNGEGKVLAFFVEEPSIDIRIHDKAGDIDVTNGQVTQGTWVNFRVDTNLYQIAERPGASGIINIVVKNPDGLQYSELYGLSLTQKTSLIDLYVNSSPYYWTAKGNTTTGWNTGIVEPSGKTYYKVGTYYVWAECFANSLNSNNKEKAISSSKTIQLELDQIKLTLMDPTILRGNTSTVRVEGLPSTEFILWVKECPLKMTGYECDQPPLIEPGYDLKFDPENGPFDIGNTPFECGNCNNMTVRGSVPKYPYNGTKYYTESRTQWDSDLKKYVKYITFRTNPDTKPGSYIIRAERVGVEITSPVYDEQIMTVNLGEVTISMNSTAYLGEGITITGTNFDSASTYLFMTGPCQPPCGANLTSGKLPVVNTQAFTFTRVSVINNKWQYIWKTKDLPIELGDYEIYAASKPNDKSALTKIACGACGGPSPGCAAWSSAQITFLKPEITASLSPSSVAVDCCNQTDIVIQGKTTGNPEKKIVMWVFGENKVGSARLIRSVIPVLCDDTFSISLSSLIDLKQLKSGIYDVILQHPMYNHEFDVIREIDRPAADISPTQPSPLENNGKLFVVGAVPVKWSKLFQYDGTDCITGTTASQALQDALNNPMIDDEYVLLHFTIQEYNPLSANFGGMPVNGPAPLTVQFNDLSTGSPTSWSWTFGDGYTSTEKNPVHIYTQQGTYDVSLTVTGVSGTSSTSKNGYIIVSGAGPTPTVTTTQTPVPGSNTIYLYSGWNFISTPRVLADSAKTAGVVFANVDTAGHSIYLYDAGSGVWMQMTASSVVQPLDGIWIYSAGYKEVPLTFRNDPLQTPPTKQLYTGWNAIGYSDVSAAAAKDDLISVKNQWTQAIGFSGSLQAYETSLINGGTGSHSDTNPMYPTKGYWLFMNSPGTLAAISA